MNGKIVELMSSVLNPVTGKSIVDEKRIVEINESGDELTIKYDRTGIGAAEKRALEDSILKAIQNDFDPNKITMQSVSSGTDDVYKNTSQNDDKKEPANLKVGHGKLGNKIRVAGAKKVIAVASGKGGVGKSTFAVNLALSLKNIGKKVGILDADIYGPSVPMLLNKRDSKPVAGSNKKILPISAYGLSFISFGLFVQESDPVIWRGPMLGGVLNQFLFDVDWGDLDYLIIDLPPGTGDMQLSMIQNTEVDGVVIISTPQDVALLDAKKGLNMFKAVDVEVLGMVENMSYFICNNCSEKHYLFGQDGVEKACTELDVPFLGSIPFEKSLREGSDAGTPHMGELSNEGSEVWNSYSSIANII